nr:phosphofructokinase 4 [Tanacetum cinerariifolium]
MKACIVTCGGLCPGSNTGIKEIMCGLNNIYGVNNILGIEVGHCILDFAALYPEGLAEEHEGVEGPKEDLGGAKGPCEELRWSLSSSFHIKYPYP